MVPQRKTKVQRQFFSYSEEDMQNALRAVQEGCSKKQAAHQYNIPRSTLIRKLSGRVPLQRKMGPPPELSETEENVFEQWILNMAKKGFPVHKSNLCLSVQKFLQDAGRETRFLKNDTGPGRSWFEGFLKRHPNVKQKHAEALGKARAAVTKDRIYGWFDEITHYFQENNIQDILLDGSRIFNGDEAGFSLCPKSGKVLGPTKSKEDFYERVASEKEQITVLATFSASGEVVPPMLIFPYKKMPRAIVESVPDTWGLGRSESGWMNSEVFYEYIANHFVPYIKSKGIQRPVVLFVDGHRSHLTQQVSRLCDDSGVILISLYPNTTHIMQPADVSVFKPLKSGWSSAVRTWKFENFPKDVTRYTFGTILDKVFKEYATKQTIINGFRKSGLFPFEKNNVDYSKCIPNRVMVSDQQNSEEKEANDNFQKRVLAAVEEKIDKDELRKFRETFNQGEEWNGNRESLNLYQLWHDLNRDVGGKVPQQVNELNSPEIQYTSTTSPPKVPQRINEVDAPDIQHTRGTPPPTSPIPSTSTGASTSFWMTPEDANLVHYQEKEKQGWKVPTPFKKCLVFPKTPDKNTPKRKRTIFPAVVSSHKYRAYYEDEMNKKITPKGRKKQQQQVVNDSSSDSDANVVYNDEDLDLSEPDELDLGTGKYVIIKYDEKYYPGVVVKSDAEGAEVKSMVPAGVGSWKWPLKDDQIYYFREDIVCTINQPQIKNTRGHYCVPKDCPPLTHLCPLLLHVAHFHKIIFVFILFCLFLFLIVTVKST